MERILAHGLVDVGRALDPDNDRMFTWWAPWRNMRQRNIGWRLDYILASEALCRARSRAAASSATSAPAITRRWSQTSQISLAVSCFFRGEGCAFWALKDSV